MKLIRPTVSGLLACGVLLATAVSLSAATSDQGMAKVVNIRGSARYMVAGDQNWKPLKTGAVLHPGAIIQTAADSYVDIVLNNPNATSGISAGISAPSSLSPATPPPMAMPTAAHPKSEQDAVRIYENSVLGIDKLNVMQTGADRVTETEMDLKAGKILGTVKKLSAGSTYEVKIPNGVAGIRGTTYFLDASGKFGIISGQGGLGYVDASGVAKAQDVSTGQQFDASTGQLSPIPDSVMQSLTQAMSQLGSNPQNLTVVFAEDHCIHFVSPKSGVAQGGG